MDPHAFDRLARTFRQSASRRRALGGLLGGALGALGGAGRGDARRRHRHEPRRDAGGNGQRSPGGASACAHFCAALFAPGPDRGQCTSDAARGQGLCATCGPDPRAVCCAKPNGFCASYATAGCCGGGCTPKCAGQACGADDGCGGRCNGFCDIVGETCVQGQCVCASGVICGPACCAAGQVCDPQSFACCTPKTCRDYPPSTCGPQANGCGGTIDCGCCPGTPCHCAGKTTCDQFHGCPGTTCFCAERADGAGSVCYTGGACFKDMAICATDDDCAEVTAPGLLCVKAGVCATGCVQTACVAPCSGTTSRPPRLRRIVLVGGRERP